MSASISSLPSELLLDIFRNVQSGPLGAKYDIVHVSRVCRLWRDLSLSASAFWSSISVDRASVCSDLRSVDPYTASESEVFPWVTTLLHRSGRQLLDVEINMEGARFDRSRIGSDYVYSFIWTTKHSIVLSRLLAPHASRLRTVTITSETWRPVPFLAICLVGMPMSSLKEWHCDVTQLSPPSDYEFVPDADGNTFISALEAPHDTRGVVEVSAEGYGAEIYPNLTVLCLYGVVQRWNSLLPCNLVELSLEYIPVQNRPSYRDLRAFLLANERSLESLRLWAAISVESGSNFTLSNLRTLSIGFMYPEEAVSFASKLSLPKLTDLEIYDMTARDPQNFQSARMMLATTILLQLYLVMISQWPLSQLQHLTLRSSTFPIAPFEELDVAHTDGHASPFVPVFLSFLLQCSSLQRLRLVDPDKTTLRALVTPVYISGVDEAPLPCMTLEELVINCERFEDVRSFFLRNSLCALSQTIVTRKIDRIFLEDAPPSWLAILGIYISRAADREVENVVGPWICSPS
ncbi:hypothetical protein D9757_006546 [Collybiopsis confluens]|uniref:F-box domain-containing protein n=1 Tax=Collybiopsis confluens TaxID=2823264 RepID=A0A8H5HQ69_9AGAR|nr:hypothetical protein D9757_006546 [Collybiopsis confluens]